MRRVECWRRCPRDLVQFKVSSGLKRGPENEAKPIHRRADHIDFEGARDRCSGVGSVSQARRELRQHLQVEAKYGGMEVSEAKRLKSLADENAKLKRMLADAMLDNVALKDLLGKNGSARRSAGSCCLS